MKKHFPAMVSQYERFGIDISKDPVLIYPTLHYQNGGVKIDVNGESDVKHLFVAGEASGGLHGRNRLMGNSLLDLMVFGKRSGTTAAHRARSMNQGNLTLDHLVRFRSESERHGVSSAISSPMVLPAYARKRIGACGEWLIAYGRNETSQELSGICYKLSAISHKLL